jgi:hypothetical protein
MARYFIFGNVWLAFALLLIVGGRTESTGLIVNGTPIINVAFFGQGASLSYDTYTFLTLLCVAASVACFVLTWRTRDARLPREKDVVS